MGFPDIASGAPLSPPDGPAGGLPAPAAPVETAPESPDVFVPGPQAHRGLNLLASPGSRMRPSNLYLLERNFRALDKVEDPALRRSAWEALLRRLRRDQEEIPAGIETYESFLERLRGAGGHLPERVSSLRTAVSLLRNADRLADPERAGALGAERPLLVFVMGTADHNGALSGPDFTALDETVRENQFDVIYVEASRDFEAESVADIAERTGRRIHTLMIAAHGLRNAVVLGYGDETAHTVEGEERLIDGTDFSSGSWAALDEAMEPDGQIVLVSCLTGADASGETFQGEETANVRDLFRRAAPGRVVLAPTRETLCPSIKFDDETLEAQVVWRLI